MSIQSHIKEEKPASNDYSSTRWSSARSSGDSNEYMSMSSSKCQEEEENNDSTSSLVGSLTKRRKSPNKRAKRNATITITVLTSGVFIVGGFVTGYVLLKNKDKQVSNAAPANAGSNGPGGGKGPKSKPPGSSPKGTVKESTSGPGHVSDEVSKPLSEPNRRFKQSTSDKTPQKGFDKTSQKGFDKTSQNASDQISQNGSDRSRRRSISWQGFQSQATGEEEEEEEEEEEHEFEAYAKLRRQWRDQEDQKIIEGMWSDMRRRMPSSEEQEQGQEQEQEQELEQEQEEQEKQLRLLAEQEQQREEQQREEELRLLAEQEQQREEQLGEEQQREEELRLLAEQEQQREEELRLLAEQEQQREEQEQEAIRNAIRELAEQREEKRAEEERQRQKHQKELEELEDKEIEAQKQQQQERKAGHPRKIAALIDTFQNSLQQENIDKEKRLQEEKEQKRREELGIKTSTEYLDAVKSKFQQNIDEEKQKKLEEEKRKKLEEENRKRAQAEEATKKRIVAEEKERRIQEEEAKRIELAKRESEKQAKAIIAAQELENKMLEFVKTDPEILAIDEKREEEMQLMKMEDERKLAMSKNNKTLPEETDEEKIERERLVAALTGKAPPSPEKVDEVTNEQKPSMLHKIDFSKPPDLVVKSREMFQEKKQPAQVTVDDFVVKESHLQKFHQIVSSAAMFGYTEKALQNELIHNYLVGKLSKPDMDQFAHHIIGIITMDKPSDLQRRTDGAIQLVEFIWNWHCNQGKGFGSEDHHVQRLNNLKKALNKTCQNLSKEKNLLQSLQLQIFLQICETQNYNGVWNLIAKKKDENCAASWEPFLDSKTGIYQMQIGPPLYDDSQYPFITLAPYIVENYLSKDVIEAIGGFVKVKLGDLKKIILDGDKTSEESKKLINTVREPSFWHGCKELSPAYTEHDPSHPQCLKLVNRDADKQRALSRINERLKNMKSQDAQIGTIEIHPL